MLSMLVLDLQKQHVTGQHMGRRNKISAKLYYSMKLHRLARWTLDAGYGYSRGRRGRVGGGDVRCR